MKVTPRCVHKVISLTRSVYPTAVGRESDLKSEKKMERKRERTGEREGGRQRDRDSHRGIDLKERRTVTDDVTTRQRVKGEI